ncbi:hypothetical protein JCGZ_19461 [Jatropha curcas]|uniref:Uncharacterized protein n=1 Tax=Jatropha curcas TaxID=180498 RepID=A0A067KAM7_JATCU|nr:hypothetical protein JCGZ_19461 [Jatropha curcas]
MESYAPPASPIAPIATVPIGLTDHGAPRYGQDAFLRQMADILRQAVGATAAIPPAYVPAPRPPIERLRKYGAIEFKGRKSDDASAVEYWLESTEQIFDQM